MKVTMLENKGNLLALRVEGVTPAYLNTLRRLAMSEVPTMAIEKVEFGKNNSILYDEAIAHRLGLIPLTTDLKGYSLKEKRGEEGNPSTEAKLTLKISKVKNEHVVTAGEFESSDPKIRPVFPDMPITKLIDGQELELVATAELGLGKEHTKWSPGLCYYRQYPHITVTKQPRAAKAVIERYPGVFELKADKLQPTAQGGYAVPDVELDLEDGECQIEYKDGDYIFVVESWGQLEPASIIEQALAVYDEQLEALAKTL